MPDVPDQLTMWGVDPDNKPQPPKVNGSMLAQGVNLERADAWCAMAHQLALSLAEMVREYQHLARRHRLNGGSASDVAPWAATQSLKAWRRECRIENGQRVSYKGGGAA